MMILSFLTVIVVTAAALSLCIDLHTKWSREDDARRKLVITYAPDDLIGKELRDVRGT